MPIYEYLCPQCNHQFEVLQKISDPAVSLCPKCSHNDVVRLVSPAGFQLKGTGWYVTDFKNPKKPESTKQETTKKDSKSE